MCKLIIICIFSILALPFSASGTAQDIVGFLIPSSGLGDQSFNDMTYSGLIQARSKHNFTLIREQCEDFTNKSRQEAMDRLLVKGATVIVVNGWEYKDLLEKYAPTYPERTFLIHDFPLLRIDNVVSTVFGQHEGSFLAGALAGWMSKSGQIAFIGGMDMPVIRSFQSGFAEGAKFANPDIRITEVFLSTPEEALSGFNNPVLAFTVATRLYKEGNDIIFGAAGLSGNGIIRAAREQEKFAIGVDADQDHLAEGYVLTSVMKRLDKATTDILDKIFSNDELEGVYSFGLKESGVSLSPMLYTKDIIPDIVHQNLALTQQKIIDGEIRVNNPVTSHR